MLQLPDDVLMYLGDFLTNKDRKVLRLADRRLNASFPLRMDRVFLSASYKNIEVFRAVAAHPLRKQVKEIIWDDAQFEKFVLGPGEPDEDESMPWERAKGIEEFEKFRKYNLEWTLRDDRDAFIRTRRNEIERRSAHPLDTGPVLPNEDLSLEESFELYSRLYEEQETIRRDALDIEAFKEGLIAFTELERVTVTSAAYEPDIIQPFYPTPLIRSLPLGFNYPQPRPWMHDELDDNYYRLRMDDIRTHWRGALAAIDGLANFDDRPVPELVIDTRHVPVGLPYRFFEINSPELRSFAALCQRLRRLELAVKTFSSFGNPGLQRLPHSWLPEILAKATSLESFSLHTTSRCDEIEFFSDDLQVLSIVPLESWPSLREITLSYIPVDFEDLLQFFKRLPQRLKSVKLVTVAIANGTYKRFLEMCRDELQWSPGLPKFIIGQNIQEGRSGRGAVWIEDEIADFLVGKGHNPFVGQMPEHFIQDGYGTVRDELDLDYSRPWLPDPLLQAYVSPGVYRWRTREEVAEEEAAAALEAATTTS